MTDTHNPQQNKILSIVDHECIFTRLELIQMTFDEILYQ